jgi:transposase-like protein
MTAPDSLPLHALAEENLAAASPDLLRAMVKTFADARMSAEADALCNAEYGQVSEDRVNHRNGYRPREWDTRAGTVELAIPKLRSGSYFPHWLLERRRRAEQDLISVVAIAYLLGVSTRRVEKLAESLGVTQLSKSQVSAMAKHLDEQVAAVRNRPLDAGPYAFVWVDAGQVGHRRRGHAAVGEVRCEEASPLPSGCGTLRCVVVAVFGGAWR